MTKFCRNCNQNVQPSKKFSIAWFIIDCLTIVGGGVYIVYYLFMKKKSCPICNGTNFEHKHKPGELIVDDGTPVLSQKEQHEIKMVELKKKRSDIKKSSTELNKKLKNGEMPWQKKITAKIEARKGNKR